ncbi:hypothetical protein R3P38DRAFT_2994435 [Favolaschia claudopus]|uniref:MYND-type domain-containing protein n=1 Tax=Favolaschia claudopus TaxID=2862362 RepID=A0AAW0AV61_9AGAR
MADTEAKSVVGTMYAKIRNSPDRDRDGKMLISFLDAFSVSTWVIREGPSSQLRSHVYRMKKYLHPSDLPPTGMRVHDLVSLRHAVLAFQGLARVLITARKHPPLLPTIIEDLRKVWPAAWRYVKFIDEHFLSRRRDRPFDRLLRPIEDVMHVFVPSLYELLSQPELTETLTESGVYNLFVRLWFRLATDEECAEWPVRECIWGFRDVLPYGRRPEIRSKIIEPLGGEVNVAIAAVSHLRASTRVLRDAAPSRPDEGQILLAYQMAEALGCLHYETKVAFSLLTQGSVRYMTRAALPLLALSPPAPVEIDLSVHLGYLGGNLDLTDSISWVIQAFDAGILVVLLRYDIWYSKQPRSKLRHPGPRHAEILLELLPSFLVFFSVVRAARKAFRKARKCGAEEGVSRKSKIWSAWVVFEDILDKRLSLVGELVRGRNVCNKCGKVEPRDLPFSRCSGCGDLLYCSTRCQRADWKTQHRQDCKRISRNRLAGWTVNASDRDYAFLPVFIQQEFPQMGLSQLCSRTWRKDPPAKPSVFIDYTTFPVSVFADAKRHDFDGPERREVVCVHVTLRTEEKTWFALRSDEWEDNRKDRLIKALSKGSVVRRAEPGVEREGDWWADKLLSKSDGKLYDLDDVEEEDGGSDWTDDSE